MTTDMPPATARPRPRRRAGAPHGRRRQGAASGSAARPSSSACWRGSRRSATRIILNANGDPGALRRHAACRWCADTVPDFAGPLAGILAGLDWAAAQRARRRPTSRACRATARSCPRDLVARLLRPRAPTAGTPLACARSGDWRHPVVGLWPVALRDDLRHALVEEGLRKIEVWTARHGVAIADWPAEPVDPFFNVNTPEDVAEADAHCGAALRRVERLISAPSAR